MSLFRNTKDLKLFADIHSQTSWDTLRPYVEQAENDYIIPLISQAEFDIYDAAVNDPFNKDKSFEQIFTVKQRIESFKIIARSLANFALFEAFPFLNTSVGDIGVTQQQSKEGTSTAAPQWRYESRRTAHLNTADSYLEKLLTYFEKNAEYFTAWASSASYTITRDLLISNSLELAEYIGTNDSRRAYIAIRPFIRLAEINYLIPILGKELYDQLKLQSRTNPTTFSAGNTSLLVQVKEALAWTAYYMALPMISIRINGDGVQVVSKNDSVNSRSAATKEEKETARAQAGQLSDRFLNTLRKFMDDNVEAYPLYKTYWLSRYPVATYRRKHNTKGSGHFAV